MVELPKWLSKKKLRAFFCCKKQQATIGDAADWIQYWPVAALTFRLLRMVSFLALVFLALMSYTYTPYHLQMRRLAIHVQSNIGPSRVFAVGEGLPDCNAAIRNIVETNWVKLDNSDSVGYRGYNNTVDYTSQFSGKTGWDTIQKHSKWVSICEYILLPLLILSSIWFIVHCLLGTFLVYVKPLSELCCKGCCVQGKNEFYTQIGYVAHCIVVAVVVIIKQILVVQITDAHEKIIDGFQETCAMDTDGACFESGQAPLCVELQRSSWLGQTDVKNIDIIRFGSIAEGSCDGITSDRVTFGSPDYFATGGEGWVPYVGNLEFNCVGTNTLIVSMTIFTIIYACLAFFDLISVVYSMVAMCKTKTLGKIIPMKTLKNIGQTVREVGKHTKHALGRLKRSRQSPMPEERTLLVRNII